MSTAFAETLSSPVKSPPWQQTTIAGTPYTVDWLLEALNEDGNEISDVEISNVTGGGGFVSQIIRIVLKYRNRSAQKSVILKAPIPDSFEDGFEQVNIDYFNRELEFYDVFLPYLTIPVPKIHKMVKWIPEMTAGAILMEDLTELCHILPVCQSLSLQQVLNIAEHLADLHNSFLSLPDDQRAELSARFPPQEGCIHFQVDLIVPRAFEVARKHAGVFGAKLERFADILRDADYHRYTSATLSEPIGVPRVLVHGDLWSNNILWRNGADSTVIGAFLDWQGFMVGSLAFDLSRILCLCTSTEIRRENTKEIVSHYYRKLKNPTFRESAVIKAIDETMPYQCAHMLFAIQLVEERCDNAGLETMISRASAALDDCLEREISYHQNK